MCYMNGRWTNKLHFSYVAAGPTTCLYAYIVRARDRPG